MCCTGVVGKQRVREAGLDPENPAETHREFLTPAKVLLDDLHWFINLWTYEDCWAWQPWSQWWRHYLPHRQPSAGCDAHPFCRQPTGRVHFLALSPCNSAKRARRARSIGRPTANER